MRSVAIAVTTFRNPPRLRGLLANMRDSGLPNIPVYIFEDPSPHKDRYEVTAQNARIAKNFGFPMFTAPYWGCMQGIIDYAFRLTQEDWLIYVPDDVLFQPGGLLNEYLGVLDNGFDFVGGIQAPYWNVHELPREVDGEVPRNPHWEGPPRKYINLNGAGFSMSRRLYNVMGGWPTCTWRLDEWAGYQAWKNDMVIITLPGPPRIHIGAGGSSIMGVQTDFHTEENWAKATGGLRPSETAQESYALMDRIPGEYIDDIIRYYFHREQPTASQV